MSSLNKVVTFTGAMLLGMGLLFVLYTLTVIR